MGRSVEESGGRREEEESAREEGPSFGSVAASAQDTNRSRTSGLEREKEEEEGDAFID